MSLGEKIGQVMAKVDMDKLSNVLMVGGIIITSLSSLAGREASKRQQKAWIEESVARRLPHETK